jgi:hypothetical protein
MKTQPFPRWKLRAYLKSVATYCNFYNRAGFKIRTIDIFEQKQALRFSSIDLDLSAPDIGSE